MNTISELVEKEVQRFKEQSIILTDGISFNQYRTIQRINKYVNSKFWSCPDPNALFWNLSTPRIPLFAKSIDMDTKDFKVVGVGKTNWFKAWILNVRFRKWARDNRFALTLNDISEGLATYGSAVWKLSKERGKTIIEEVDLRNLYFDPTVKNIRNSPVVELHYLTESQIRAKYPDKADEVIRRAEKARDEEDHDAESEDEKYRVWERWGEYKKEEGDDAKYVHMIGTGSGEFEVVLFEEEIKLDKDGLPTKFPYYDFHVAKYSGRWMRMGVVEKLFGLQEQMNTLVNQNAEANNIASLLLFRTSDPTTRGNVLQSAVSGQIINSQDFQEIPIDNRFIQTFLNQLQIIEKKADELCFIQESISGELPPSGVPFRSLAVSSRIAVGTFKYIKESIGEKMGIIIQEKLLPEAVKDFQREDVIEISEDENDVRMYDQLVIEQAVENYTVQRAEEGFVVFEEEIQQMVTELQDTLQRDRRIFEVPDNFFDFEYGVLMNPTGESADKNVQNSVMEGAISYMLSAPAIVNTPIFKQYLANNGIPPFRLSPEEQQSLQQSATGQTPQQPEEDKLSELAEVSE
jgi:hypothetical protein